MMLFLLLCLVLWASGAVFGTLLRWGLDWRRRRRAWMPRIHPSSCACPDCRVTDYTSGWLARLTRARRTLEIPREWLHLEGPIPENRKDPHDTE